MTVKELIVKILELGKELETANETDALMIINDMEIEVNNYLEKSSKKFVHDGLTEDEHKEREILLMCKRNHNRWFTQQEYDRLRELNNKIR